MHLIFKLCKYETLHLDIEFEFHKLMQFMNDLGVVKAFMIGPELF